MEMGQKSKNCIEKYSSSSYSFLNMCRISASNEQAQFVSRPCAYSLETHPTLKVCNGLSSITMRPRVRVVLRWVLLVMLAATFAAFSSKAAFKYASGRTGVSITEKATTEFM